MAKQETVTVYFGTDPYIINKADMNSFIEKGFTKKLPKAATAATDSTTTTNETIATPAATTTAAANK